MKNLYKLLFIIFIFSSCNLSNNNKDNTSVIKENNNNQENPNVDKENKNKENTNKDTSNIFTDSRDGKKYKTLKIGTQTWMAENLAFKTEGGCWAYNDNQSNVATYGYLYNWQTAMNACPKGWHLPTEAEWITFANSPNSSYYFSPLTAGFRNAWGEYHFLGEQCQWWSASEDGRDGALYRTTLNGRVTRPVSSLPKTLGLSVRCIKD